jgi:hypothetical protein
MAGAVGLTGFLTPSGRSVWCGTIVSSGGSCVTVMPPSLMSSAAVMPVRKGLYEFFASNPAKLLMADDVAHTHHHAVLC